MKSNLEIFCNAANNSVIENATPKECILANLAQILIYKSKDILYKDQLYKIIQNPHEEYENFIEGDNIVKIITSYKIILGNRGKYYLTNTWGINTDELTNDIKKFELDFKNFFNDIDKNVRKEFDDFREKINITNLIDFNENENEHKDYSITVLYAYYNIIGKLDKEIAFTNLYLSHIEKYNELKHKIYNAATKNSYEYIAELRANVNQDPDNKHLPFEACIFIIMLLNQLYENSRNKKYDKESNELKRIYNKFTATKDINALDVIMKKIPIPEFDLLNDDFQSIIKDSGGLISMLNFLCNNNIKYTYIIYHWVLSTNKDINELKKHHLKCGVGRLLYEGYCKWCKKIDIKPLIEFSRSQLIEYPSNANDTQYHFPKKRFIDNPINEKREKLNIYFLKVLHKGMIDGKIIDANTKPEIFIFVFGYGGDKIENFKPIGILKPDTNYARENGKRTIRYLLEELMKYSDDEVRPLIKKDKHLIINSCFSITNNKFKSSDFNPEPNYKGKEIDKIKNIYETALNKAKKEEHSL